jgi:Fe-S-cluster containining protein
MPGLSEIQGIFSGAVDPRAGVAAYLRLRGELASAKSDFVCDPACTRPGCRNEDLQVEVSLIDLLGAAGRRGESVSALYRRYYSLGLFSDDRDDWIRRVSLKLRKPCPFLEEDLCSIYPVRPLPCALFPEYLAAEGKLDTEAAQDHFRDYPCLHRSLTLSPARAGVMASLKGLWRRETLATSFHLWQHGRVYVDFSNLTGELMQAAAAAGPEGRPGPQTVPHRILEHFFRERLAPSPPFAGISDRIGRLDHREGTTEFLRLFQDDRLAKKLKQTGDDRARVFRLRKGRVRATRRSLTPMEYG